MSTAIIAFPAISSLMTFAEAIRGGKRMSNEITVPSEIVVRMMRRSEFLRSVATALACTRESRGLRMLTTEEIKTLKDQHNAAEEWSRVWVAKDFNPHKVVGCYFSGDVDL